MPRKSPVAIASIEGVATATRASAVYERLRADIAHGVLEPGSKLRVGAMSERYGVGASPLREALSRLSAEGLVFPLGYPLGRVFLIWGAAMLGCVPTCYLLVRSQHAVAKVGAGTLLAALAVAVQMSWVAAVGFRPGVIWRMEFVAVAVVLLLLGFTTATWTSFSEGARVGSRRQLWRLGGAALLGLTLMAGQEVLMAGAGLLAQVGSVYQREVPAAWLCLVGGVVVPLVLSVMALNLELRRRARRQGRREGSSSLQLQKRRKKRHHVRQV